ncbi:MAG: lyase domain protein repeat-containing protein [Pedosphaera sp.]|nr:lyase domain protein repeat-containing protein [Pedosphaera sp.]
MRKRFRILLAIFLMAIVGGIAWHYLSPSEPEPVYEGKTLTQLLESYFRSPTPEAMAKTMEAVPKMGTNALPTLIRMLQAKDSPLKLKLIGLANKQSLIKIAHIQADEYHQLGAYGCSLLKEQAAPAIPALAELFQTSPWGLTANALVATGPSGVTALVGCLTNKNHDLRLSAIGAMSGIGIQRHMFPNLPQEQKASLDLEAKIAVSALIKLLEDEDDSIRGATATALGQFDREADIIVPLLIARLQQDLRSGEAPISEIDALGEFHDAAEAAIPTLLIALTNSSPDIQSAAATALYQISPTAAANAGIKME